MKAVLQAGWLLTVAVGNIIVLIVAELVKIPKKVDKKCNLTSTTMKTTHAVIFKLNSTSLSPVAPKWAEYVMFASLLVAVCVIFSFMAYFYTYMDPAEIEAQFRKKDGDDDEDKNAKLQKLEVEMMKKGGYKDNKGKQTKI